MERTIWKVLGLLLVLIVSFGFIVPRLISSTSDEGVLAGIILGVATIYFTIKRIIKLIKTNK